MLIVSFSNLAGLMMHNDSITNVIQTVYFLLKIINNFLKNRSCEFIWIHSVLLFYKQWILVFRNTKHHQWLSHRRNIFLMHHGKKSTSKTSVVRIVHRNTSICWYKVVVCANTHGNSDLHRGVLSRKVGTRMCGPDRAPCWPLRFTNGPFLFENWLDIGRVLAKCWIFDVFFHWFTYIVWIVKKYSCIPIYNVVKSTNTN